jgi:hypothetical protein
MDLKLSRHYLVAMDYSPDDGDMENEDWEDDAEDHPANHAPLPGLPDLQRQFTEKLRDELKNRVFDLDALFLKVSKEDLPSWGFAISPVSRFMRGETKRSALEGVVLGTIQPRFLVLAMKEGEDREDLAQVTR